MMSPEMLGALEYGPLVFVFVAIYYAARSLFHKGSDAGKWVAEEIAKPLVASHTQLVDELKNSQCQMAETLNRIAGTQDIICDVLKEMERKSA